jgi:hypothetical protein
MKGNDDVVAHRTKANDNDMGSAGCGRIHSELHFDDHQIDIGTRRQRNTTTGRSQTGYDGLGRVRRLTAGNFMMGSEARWRTTRGAKRGRGRADSTVRTALRPGWLPRHTRRHHATTPPRLGTEARTGSQVEDTVERDLGRELGENRGASREPATARKGTRLRAACAQGIGHDAGHVSTVRTARELDARSRGEQQVPSWRMDRGTRARNTTRWPWPGARGRQAGDHGWARASGRRAPRRARELRPSRS